MKFWKSVGAKLIENLISVKVWTIFVLMVISTVLVWHDKISGDIWAAVNGGVISTVFALREGFKVAKVRKLENGDAKDMKI